MAGPFDTNDIFGNILGSNSGYGRAKKPGDPDNIPDSKKIELQHAMILKLGERLVKLEDTNKKLVANNTKIIKQVQSLTTRVGKLEKVEEE